MMSAEKIVSFLTVLIGEKKFDAVIETADAYLSELQPVDVGYNSMPYSFVSMEEFLFFSVYEKSRRETTGETGPNITWVSPEATTVRQLQAYALNELGRYNETIAILKEALEKLNPVGVALRFEIVEAFLQKNQVDLAESELVTLLPMLITLPDIAKYYRRLGYCKTELGDYYTAKTCFLYSLLFQKDTLALRELAYIDEIVGNPWVVDSSKENDEGFSLAVEMSMCMDIARKQNLLFIPTKTQISCAEALVAAYEEAGNRKNVEKYKRILWFWDDITKNEASQESPSEPVRYVN